MIKKFLPDFITSLNVVCGLVGVAFAFAGRCEVAFIMMLAAAVFDFCDGFAARALGAYSDMGKELDSLCDMVSFGVLPAAMLYKTSAVCPALSWFPLLIAVFSALRLAKFNVDERQKSGFIGLPTPACAMLCAALCTFVVKNDAGLLASWFHCPAFVPVLSVVLSYLLISEIPMFSMKISKDAPRSLTFKRISFLVEMLLCAVICIIFKLDWSLAVFLGFVIYILKNLVYAVFKF